MTDYIKLGRWSIDTIIRKTLKNDYNIEESDIKDALKVIINAHIDDINIIIKQKHCKHENLVPYYSKYVEDCSG